MFSFLCSSLKTNIMYQIKKGGTPPKTTIRHSYPFREMQVNDYFEVEADHLSRVRNSAYGFANRHGGKFSIVKADNGKYECWRIK